MLSPNPNVSMDDIARADAWVWAWHNQIQLVGSAFEVQDHEYQAGMMQSRKREKVYIKAAQMCVTESAVLKILHGMIHRVYPVGAMYLFPTDDDVGEFSKTRFSPLIRSNPETIGQYVRSTDATYVKQIGDAFLFLHGARATQRIEDKKDSSKARSSPADVLVLDERDLMEDVMVDMFDERLSHSRVKEKISLSTPTIPDWGIDAQYKASTQSIWMIKCEHCGKETCLELEFPDCLQEQRDGSVLRVCRHCKREILPRNGQWVQRFPEKEVDGFWISQLNSMRVDPKEILKKFVEAKNLQELYNSKLGMAYVAVENKLNQSEVFACCGKDAMAVSSNGPCAMGVDVGNALNVVIGLRPSEKRYKLLRFERLSSFNDVHDLAKRFNVKVAVIDGEPEIREAKRFADAEPYLVWRSDYNDNLMSGAVYKDDTGVVQVNRTTACDDSAWLVRSGLLEIPRRCEEVELFAKQVAKPAKALKEDLNKNRKFYYTKGEDHYRHALNYFQIAAEQIGIAQSENPRDLMQQLLAAKAADNYDPMTHGLGLGRN